jgi:hypothetical protein
MRIDLKKNVNKDESRDENLGNLLFYSLHDDNKMRNEDSSNVGKSTAWLEDLKCRTNMRIQQFFYFGKIPC